MLQTRGPQVGRDFSFWHEWSERLTLRSIIQPVAKGRTDELEWLDTAPPLAAARNLRDLARINRWFGGQRALLSVLQGLVHPQDRFSILDIGAASGDMGKCISRLYRNASVVSFDYRIAHLRSAAPPCVVGDAFALPFRDRSYDFVYCSSFLHHFPDRQATELVAKMLRLARKGVIVLDLERHPLAYLFLPLTKWLLDWSELTVHDGCASVASSFKPAGLRKIGLLAGAKETLIKRHLPWFRISMVISSIPNHHAAC
jgi:SAM-dependent methyltransferase